MENFIFLQWNKSTWQYSGYSKSCDIKTHQPTKYKTGLINFCTKEKAILKGYVNNYSNVIWRVQASFSRTFHFTAGQSDTILEKTFFSFLSFIRK